MRAIQQNKYHLYLNAFINAVNEYGTDQDVTKVIFYGVKLINSQSQAAGYDEALNGFQLASAITDLMGQLTPAEFMNIFPITKDFKGHKWETKDYFYTMDYIKTLDPCRPIGENVMEFMWEYTNWEITLFNVEIMGYISDLRRYEGKPSLAEEWASMNGIQTYTLHQDSNGKEYMIDKAGKTIRVRKPRPKHLKLIK